MSSPLSSLEIKFVSSSPKQEQSFGNVSKPFTVFTWLTLLVTILSISIGLYASYSMYSSLHLEFVKHESSLLNFILFPFCKVTEPEPLPWFVIKGTSGHFQVFLWTVLAWLMVMFYQCNLRANLISKEYEKPIKSLQDVLERSSKIWITETLWNSFEYNSKESISPCSLMNSFLQRS